MDNISSVDFGMNKMSAANVYLLNQIKLMQVKQDISRSTELFSRGKGG